MADTLRRRLKVQFIGMVVIGVVTTAALYVLGIPAALPLGILAGILEFIPNVGPVIAAVPAVLMGFLDGPEKALWVVVSYILIQQLESILLVPILMQEGVDLPPVLIILAQALMAIVFGFLGLLIAAPLLAVVVVAVKMVYVEGAVGDSLEEVGGTP
jgi:predicted PurR-regulated permease PerM